MEQRKYIPLCLRLCILIAFAGGLVGDHNVAGKILRHAGVVIFDMEFLQIHRKRQILHNHTITGIQTGKIADTRGWIQRVI